MTTAAPVRAAAAAVPGERLRSRLVAEVRAGLTGTPRSLPSKYFYDDRGSVLFEAITQLPEYYQTRTEEALLAAVADELVRETRPEGIVELGSGAGRKVRLLLEAVARTELPRRLTVFDINPRFVRTSAARLAAAYPGLRADAVVGDFTEDLAGLGRAPRRLAILFGGTLGNLAPFEVPAFLRRLGRQLGAGSHFLVGVDTVKDPARLEAAYNDTAGVTAAFNLNILRHLNRVLDGNFDLARFAHRAFWDPEREWIEMRLVATAPSAVHLPGADLAIRFAAGDEIRTEISCKYTRDSFGALLPATGFALTRWDVDTEGLFALALLRRTA